MHDNVITTCHMPIRMCPWRLCNSLLVVVQAITPRLKPYCSCLVLDYLILCSDSSVFERRSCKFENSVLQVQNEMKLTIFNLRMRNDKRIQIFSLNKTKGELCHRRALDPWVLFIDGMDPFNYY